MTCNESGASKRTEPLYLAKFRGSTGNQLVDYLFYPPPYERLEKIVLFTHNFQIFATLRDEKTYHTPPTPCLLLLVLVAAMPRCGTQMGHGE